MTRAELRKRAKENRIEFIWREDRDDIFISRLADDVGRLQEMGFSSREIILMMGSMDYVAIWQLWPRWAWPCDRLPEGYSWRDGTDFRIPVDNGNVTIIFLEAGNDLYLKFKNKRNAYMKGFGFPGCSYYDDVFLRIRDFRRLSLDDIRAGGFDRMLEKWWIENGGRITNRRSIMFDGRDLREEWNTRKRIRALLKGNEEGEHNEDGEETDKRDEDPAHQ